MDAPAGTFIMYSAGVGETALDRLPGNDPDKVNSIYTRKLVPLMKTPGIPLHELARQLRLEVNGLAASVPHVQQPAYYDGLIGKFCLAGCQGAQVADTPKLNPFTEELRRREYMASTTKYFRCTMTGGVMDKMVYSFSIDPASKKAAWAEYGVPLEVKYIDDLRIHTDVKLRISGWPEHDHIGFNFNRLTLAVEAALIHTPSPKEISQCRSLSAPDFSKMTDEQLKAWRPAPSQSKDYCHYPDVVATSSGACDVIMRPEDTVVTRPTIPDTRPTIPAPAPIQVGPRSHN
jgi:hypothetical protein